jgi:AraC-like DNA-binding protein
MTGSHHPSLQALTTKNIRTDDPDEFSEKIRGFASSSSTHKRNERTPFLVDATAVRLGQLSILKARLTNGHIKWDKNSTFVSATMPVDGPAEIIHQNNCVYIERGNTHVGSANEPFELYCPEKRTFLACNFTEQLLARTLKDLSGRTDPIKCKLHTVLNKRSAEVAAFNRLVSHFWVQFFQMPMYWQNQKMLEHLEACLASAFVLSAYDIDWEGRSIDSGNTQKILREAVDFMHANLNYPLTLAQISATTGVNARTLTRSFQRAHGLGPVGYHRRLRLERVHLELITASAAETTVTDVAMKYGFYQLSHFSAAYKMLFGETPVETLKG